jgi:hypothetical protein
MVSVDKESLERSKTPTKIRDLWFHEMITEKTSSPIALIRSKVKDKHSNEMEVYVVTNGSITEELFLYKRKLDKWRNNSQVLVYSKETKVDHREFFFLEACTMTKPENKTIKVEKSNLLIVITPMAGKEAFITQLTEQTQTINMVNFKIDEFKVQGSEICKYVKFYTNECTGSLNESEFTFVNFFAILLITTILRIVTLIIEVFIIEKVVNGIMKNTN